MPRRKEKSKKYHFIYKTTCNITEFYYYGMHSTNNLEDGYLGSGRRLKYSIKKYGKENHSIKRLEFFNSRKELANKEEEIVNENEIAKKECLNIIKGGEFFDSVENSKMVKELWKNPEYRRKVTESMKKTSQGKSGYFSSISKENWKDPEKRKRMSWLGKIHSSETKALIGSKNSINQDGANNSQYGTCWITNEKESKKINKGDLIPEGWRLGRKIKK